MAGGELKGLVVGLVLMFFLAVLYVKNQPQVIVVRETEMGEDAQSQHAGVPPHHHHAHPQPPQPPQPPPPEQAAVLARMPRVCLQGDTSEAYYKCRREALLKGCSEICDTSIKGEPSLHFNFARKHVDCGGLWMNEEIDASLGDGQWPPPEYPPDVFINDYRQHGAVEVIRQRYLQQRYSGGNALENQWTKENVDAQVQQARQGQLVGSYTIAATNEIRLGLTKMDVKGKRVLVIGSERPWVEACALEAGAAEVWTLEYGRIVSTHPQIKTFTPDEAREAFRKHELPLFDAVITYSSVEHSGLGRYGDALNPWGDLQAIARAWCVTKPGGQMLLGVMECRGNDSIEYNLHRCYHQHLYTQLTANWKLEYRSVNSPDAQTVMVFRKEEALAAPRT